VNPRYEVIIPPSLQKDIEQIIQGIVAYSNKEDANRWEDGLYDTLDTLSITPYHQECPRETRLARVSIRKILYSQKVPRRHYHIYYIVDAYPTPNPEPSTPYLAGRVSLLFIYHASQKLLSTKDIKERIVTVDAEIAELDALKMPSATEEAV
jgi:plasmid stabilization system protein ParE